MSVLGWKHCFVSDSVSTRLATSVQTKQGGSRNAPPLLIKPDSARAGIRGVMQMEKTFIGRRFNPDRYAMIYCPVCNGSGKLFEVEGGGVCKICGGFGFVKKQVSGLEKGFEHTNLRNYFFRER